MATVGVVSAQGRVDTPCAGYAVDVRQEADGYDMLLTVPLPPDRDSSTCIWKSTDAIARLYVEGDAGNNVFRDVVHCL